MIQTPWEAKERAGLIALETPEWREKRAVAEDPNTPGETLARFVDDAFSFAHQAKYAQNSGDTALRDKPVWMLLNAAALHPNTPLQTLSRLLEAPPPISTAVCQNPVLPFVLLEQPNFLADLSAKAQNYLLKNADAPLLFVRLLAGEGKIARGRFEWLAARLHVSLSSEYLTPKETRVSITIYWRGVCAGYIKGDYSDLEGDDRDAHSDLVEVGLAPLWAAGITPRESAFALPFIDPLAAWFGWTPAPDSRDERAFLRRIDPQLRNWQCLTRALRLSATPDDLRDLLRDPAYNTRDVSDIMKRAVMAHPSVTGDLLKEIVEKALKYEPEMAVHPKSPPDLIARLLQSKRASVRRLARKHPNAPADALHISRATALHLARQWNPAPPPFVSFVGAMQGPPDPGDLIRQVENAPWTTRIEAALLAGATDAPLLGDPYERTGLDLLHYLSHDGSRLVRSIAQIRLADPDWRFTWADCE